MINEQNIQLIMVLDKLRETYIDVNGGIDTDDARCIDDIRESIMSRSHGRWEYTTHYCRRYRVCSNCRCEKEDDRAAGWNFCQYCGADMRGDNNDKR